MCFCSPHWHGSACANWVMKWWINKKCGTESCALARWPKIQWRLAMFPVGLIQCGIQSVAQPVRIICTGLGLPLPYFSLKYLERERERDCMNAWTDGVGVWLNCAPSTGKCYNFFFQCTDSCNLLVFMILLQGYFTWMHDTILVIMFCAFFCCLTHELIKSKRIVCFLLYFPPSLIIFSHSLT